MEDSYLESAIKQFRYYQLLGEQTFAQLSDEQLVWQYHAEANSIAMIVNHLAGNMLSRWTDIFTSDGEKISRNREAEFEIIALPREIILERWNNGWACLINALEALTLEDLAKTIYIRNMGHTVTEAINRQLSHYPYHVGQIVFIGKMLCGENWKSLSIPKGDSEKYNANKFAIDQHKAHFLDEFLPGKNK